MEKQKTVPFPSKARHDKQVNRAVYTLLIILSLLWLCPFVFLVLQSFRGESGGQVNYILPRQWTLENYSFLFRGTRLDVTRLYHSPIAVVLSLFLLFIACFLLFILLRPRKSALLPITLHRGEAVFFILACLVFIFFLRCVDAGNSDFVRWFLNTLTIAFFCALIQTILVLSVAYCLSRLRFRGRKMLMNIILVLGMFPGFLTMIVLYYLLKMLGLTQEGAVPGLILISCASSGMGYYIAKGFFDTIPRALDESARIDGATRLQVFAGIILPLSKPIVVYTVLMGFLAPWGDYVFASYVAFGYKAGYNVAVGLYRWVNTTDYQGYFTRFCAGGVVVALPVTLLFLCLQKYYVEGITGGAVKG